MIETGSQDVEYLKGITLLYVEDDELSRELCSDFLARRVGSLKTAKNGRDGLAAYHEHHPQIVITDVEMPIMDGFSMAREIRKVDKKIPIIIFSSFDQVEYLLQSIEIGIDGYVFKPIDIYKLKETLMKLARRLLAEDLLAQQEVEASRLRNRKALDTIKTARVQSRLLLAMQSAKLGSWEHDKTTNIITLTDEFYAIYRTTAKQVGGYTMSPERLLELFVHPEDRAQVVAEMRKMSESDGPAYDGRLEHRMLYADGTSGYVSVWYKTNKDSNGRPVSVYGLVQDISKQEGIKQLLQSLLKPAPLKSKLTEITALKGYCCRFRIMPNIKLCRSSCISS